MENKLSYWSNFALTVRTLLQGLSLTLSHIVKARKSRNKISIQQDGYFDKQTGIATVQYPFETIPVPDNGRYKLHNEIEDCIVCDKCVKICPVNCITIEPIRSAEEFAKTSDGTPKRIYAAKFDIDMGKCCFCGLCTTVCPTECLTMTKEYDFATFDITEHNFGFGNMTLSDIETRKKEWEEHQKTKAASVSASADTPIKSATAKPVFKPRMNPPAQPTKSE
ncbi:MAG TPA: NADH-quinone oxidoreductase subunit I [Cyclobacteriaceae bacterium]|nr:NADH-quinone oxidoreductase subunit I [Cyclobacteriaceae bacterium]